MVGGAVMGFCGSLVVGVVMVNEVVWAADLVLSGMAV